MKPKRCSILIVEDDALVGANLVTILGNAEFDAVGPVGTVGGALDAIRRHVFDAVFLNINLNGASGLQVAAALRQKTIPFAFISGNAHAVSEDFEHVRFVNKPFEPSVVEALARDLCGLSYHGVDQVAEPLNSSRKRSR